MNTNEDDNKSDSFGEPSSDESDFDFDDESSNQSYVKSQISEKSNTFDNKLAEQECDSKVDEPTPSTEPIAETYDNYLGDENGTFVIFCYKHYRSNVENSNCSFFLLQMQKLGYSCDFQVVIDTCSSGLVRQNWKR